MHSSFNLSGFDGVSVVSLGCKVNQAESAWLKEKLNAEGLGAEEGERVLKILLTCAVTATASRQSRQMARRMFEDSGSLIVSGCDAQINPSFYHGLGAGVLPRANLSFAPTLTSSHLWQGCGPMPAPESGPWVPGMRHPHGTRNRGQLKVQDGCNAGCAYCIVPQTRGVPRSREPLAAKGEFLALAEGGALEVVLSGIHLGRYAYDDNTLADLITILLGAHPLPRIRLSSLEAMELTSRIIELLATEERLCPHLHLPLQSGSNRVLAAMGRTYKAEEYAEKAWLAYNSINGLCLGADVLVGLPGEDEKAFAETFALLESLPVAYLHVFPYSPRPGTKAVQLAGRPASALAKARAARLRDLGLSKWKAFLQKQIGRKLSVLVESNNLGRAANYSPVRLDEKFEPGQLVEQYIAGMTDEPAPYLIGA